VRLTSSSSPRISLVTPCLNQASSLEATLRSVLEQEYPNLEYIVIDGGSTDGSRELIERYASRLTYWVSDLDRGPAHALNKGFARSTGEILGWLGADDLLLPGSLSLVGDLFAQFPEVEWLTSRATSLDPEGRIVDCVLQQPWTRTWFLESTDQFIQQESTFWRRSLWVQAGAEVEERLVAYDFELWARFFRFARLHRTRGAIGAFRHRPDQISQRQRERYLSDVRTVVERERVLPMPSASDEMLSEIVFDFANWRFERVEAALEPELGAQELLLRNARLERALKECETDRAARLEVIERLDATLRESESDRAARLAAIQYLDQRLAASELDREARLEAIERLRSELGACEETRASQAETILQVGSKLEATNERLRACEDAIRAIQESRSWKLTRPLRWLSNQARRLG